MIIPYQELDDATLNNLLESYILREGTDYGEYELSFEEKATNLRKQLESGEVVIVYSELHESVNIMPAREFNTSSSV